MFAWLFRPADPESPKARDDNPEALRDTVRRPLAGEFRLPVAAPSPRPPAREAKHRRRWLPVLAGLAAAAVLACGVGLALTRPAWLTGSAAQSSAPASADIAVVPQSATADCQVPPATDDSGQQVSYATENVLDGDPSTAWRCDGDGLGRTIVFIFPAGATIHQASIVNGYAKTDPTSGAQRYAEYRRITSVSWLLPDGSILRQQLIDGDESLQPIELPAFAGTVTLRIEATSDPGSDAATRDAVLISDVAFS